MAALAAVLAGVAMTARLSREVLGKGLLNHLIGAHVQGRLAPEAEIVQQGLRVRIHNSRTDQEGQGAVLAI